MKKFRVSYLFFTASIIFFIDAIVGSFNGGELALDHITMGSALLCIGCGLESSKRKKAKKNEKNSMEDENVIDNLLKLRS